MAPTWKIGDEVAFTCDSLGTVRPPDFRHFTEIVMQRGDLGTVVSDVRHELAWKPDGWMLVRPLVWPDLLVPVHPSMVGTPAAVRPDIGKAQAEA